MLHAVSKWRSIGAVPNSGRPVAVNNYDGDIHV